MPRKRKYKFEDAVEYAKKKFDESGAEQLKDNYYLINGWRVRITNRGFYWHTQVLEEFKFITTNNSSWEEKSGKPFTSRHNINQHAVESIIDNISEIKTKRQKKKESKIEVAEKRAERRRLPKRSWCKGCPFGTHKNKCDHLQSYEESYGVISCTNEEWWNWNWCYNAERVFEDKKKPLIGYFRCKVTKERCPYNSPSIVPGEFLIIRNAVGEHFTTCEFYEGHRENPDEKWKKVDEPVVEEKPKKRKK